MKTFTQLIEEILGEGSLGHQRIGRLAKSGNLSHAHFDRYVKKHINRGADMIPDTAKGVTDADVDIARRKIADRVQDNRQHYNSFKHSSQPRYTNKRLRSHSGIVIDDKLKRKYGRQWTNLPSHLELKDVDEGYKRALRRKGPGAEQYVSNEIKRQTHRAAKSIIDIESLGNRQDRLTKHRANLELPAMRHPDPEVRANTRNIRQDIKTKRDDVAIQALDKQRGFDKMSDKLNALYKRKRELGEGSLGHKRMLRLAKSGNLPPERLKSYVVKGNQKSAVHWDRHEKMLNKIKKEWPDEWDFHPDTGHPDHPDHTSKHKDLAQEHPNNANQVVKVYNANRHKHKSINKYNGTARSYDDADARKHGIGSSKERPKLVHDRGMDSNWNKRTGWHGYKYPALDKVVHEPVK